MKLFIFDFDGTITTEDTTDLILKIPNEEQIWKIEEEWKLGRITSYECMKAQARFLKGITKKRIHKHLKQRSQLDPSFHKLVHMLKEMDFRPIIVSEGYDLSIRFHKAQEHIKDIHCSNLLVEDGTLTGELRVQNEKRWHYNSNCIGCCICKVDFLHQLKRRSNITRSYAVGDGRSDECLFQHVDVSFSLNSRIDASYQVSDLSEVMEILDGSDVYRKMGWQ